MKRLFLLFCALALSLTAHAADLTLARDGHWLVIKGAHLPGGEIRMTAYIVPNDVPALLARCAKDFPEHGK